MVKCPWCGKDIPAEEYGKHYEVCPQRLQEKGGGHSSPDLTLPRPVEIEGVIIRTYVQADGFKTLYSSIMSIYDEFNNKCSETRSPYWCTSSQILGKFARKLMKAKDELKEQGVV